MSLLAHIVGNDEPTATKALAYILRSSPDIAQALADGVLGLPDFTPGRIVSESKHNRTRPDITIDDEDGVARAFIENKFWAGLTDQQPVDYLKALPKDRPATLLFVVPEQRIPTVWSELKKRCYDTGLDLTDESSRHVRIGFRSMSVTSWKHILDLLRNAAVAGGHSAIERDILQLRGLTDRVDLDAFLPLRPEEITDVGMAQRLINYSNLVESIANRLVENGIADRRHGIDDSRRLQTGHGWYTAGRYLRVHRRFGLWLGVELEVWRDSGITPLWWRIENTDFHGVGPMWSQIEMLFADVQVYEGYKYIPIYLETGVEEDGVINHAVVQMQEIANALLARVDG